MISFIKKNYLRIVIIVIFLLIVISLIWGIVTINNKTEQEIDNIKITENQ